LTLKAMMSRTDFVDDGSGTGAKDVVTKYFINGREVTEKGYKMAQDCERRCKGKAPKGWALKKMMDGIE